MNQVEEINIIHNGGNYGWMRLEGTWENGRWRGGAIGELKALSELYPLPAEILDGRQKDGFRYPVAMYDHEEERAAITAGFAYHGRIAALRGKFIFGDIFSGRILAADLAALKKADDGIPLTVAPIEEVQLVVRDAAGNRVNVTLQELVNQKMGAKTGRADLFISQTRDGELLITSRQDGTIRMLVADQLAQR
jgi:hypothetical protein